MVILVCDEIVVFQVAFDGRANCVSFDKEGIMSVVGVQLIVLNCIIAGLLEGVANFTLLPHRKEEI